MRQSGCKKEGGWTGDERSAARPRHDALMPGGNRRFVPFAECASKTAMKPRNAGAHRHPMG
jgi:hypothetical protein